MARMIKRNRKAIASFVLALVFAVVCIVATGTGTSSSWQLPFRAACILSA